MPRVRQSTERRETSAPIRSARLTSADIKSPLAGLRFHDLRHHAITELAESQVSDQTIMAIAGHVSQKMLARYSHVRTEATTASCVGALGETDREQTRRRQKRGYDTNNDTNQDRRECTSSGSY